jgi:poly-gamma-glutamate capsule biosynthesis protein CapA/YwtB (metallophosphatase superfamily)
MSPREKGRTEPEGPSGRPRRARFGMDGETKTRPDYWRVFGISIVAIAMLAFTLAFVNFVYAQAAHSDMFSSKPYRVVVSPDAAADMKPLVEGYVEGQGKGSFELSEGPDADIFVEKGPRKGYDGTRVTGMPAMDLTAGGLQRTVRPEREYWYNYKRTGLIFKVKNRQVASFEDYLLGYWDSQPAISLNAVGDIIPGRHVAEQMAKRGVDWPFKLIAPVVNGADITYGDLECPLTNRYEVPYSGMDFVAPAKTIEGIKMLGLDVAALANNHSTNFGRPALTDTIKLLKDNKIGYAGGGDNYNEAHRPALAEAGGTRFAFLSYNGIKGSLDASATEPGVSWINLLPWYPDSEQDFETVEADIREARKQADFVVVGIHWSKEYEYKPNSSMVTLARRACDAGADMVIGQHPHSIQSLESYKGKLIAYSLGNFIFDQRFSDQVREGVVMKCQLRGNVLVSVAFEPYRINNACQTVPLKGSSGQKVLDKLFEISGWPKRQQSS